MEQPDLELAKKYAALAYALAVARGALSDVVAGDFDWVEVRRVYDATATAHIARSLGVDEEVIAVDWDEHLSSLEKRKIQGDLENGPTSDQ